MNDLATDGTQMKHGWGKGLKRMVCFFIGHAELDAWHAQHRSTHFCPRCHRGDIFFGRVRAVFYFAKHMLRDWAKPCADCGQRFGRHDDSVDHIPF